MRRCPPSDLYDRRDGGFRATGRRRYGHQRRRRRRALREAIEGGGLQLYYQPIVSLCDRSATTLEALPRWPHPERGILAPADFIEAAAQRPDLLPLERWAINAAVDQLARWRPGSRPT